MSKLYVGNLPRNATENTLAEFFQTAQYPVENIKLIRDLDSGVPRGFAFVELPEGVDVLQAIQKLNGLPLEGRQLVVSEARPQKAMGGGTGGGGKRFDNRGGGGGFKGRGGRGGGGGGGGRQRY